MIKDYIDDMNLDRNIATFIENLNKEENMNNNKENNNEVKLSPVNLAIRVEEYGNDIKFFEAEKAKAEQAIKDNKFMIDNAKANLLNLMKANSITALELKEMNVFIKVANKFNEKNALASKKIDETFITEKITEKVDLRKLKKYDYNRYNEFVETIETIEIEQKNKPIKTEVIAD